jgi:hypothetical protein
MITAFSYFPQTSNAKLLTKQGVMKYCVTFTSIFLNNQVEITQSQLADKYTYKFRSSKYYENRQSQQIITASSLTNTKKQCFKKFGLYSLLWGRRCLLPAALYKAPFFCSFLMTKY